MGVEIRTVRADELEVWGEAVFAGFLQEPKPRPHWLDVATEHYDLDHTWAGFDGDRPVATLRSFDTAFTVPGGLEVPASALTAVTVAGSHRRRGLLTEMITTDLGRAAAEGDVVSVLIAAEYGIYGRFGYGPAAEGTALVVDTPGLGFTRPVGGSVELVDVDTVRAEAPAVYDRVRAWQPGAIERPPFWWTFDLDDEEVGGERRPTFFVLGRDESGRVDGFATYRIEDHWEGRRPRCRLYLNDLVGDGVEAIIRLWQFCIGLDWVGQILAEERPVTEPLRWFVDDARAIEVRGHNEIMWLRILDLPAALGGRRYPTAGSVVLGVDDPLGLASGRVALEGGPDGADCHPTDRPADLSLSIQTLSALYLGTYPVNELARAGLVVEHRDGAVADADAMFRSPILPWCLTDF